MPDHRTENSTGISAPGFQKRKYEVENMKLKIQLRRLHRSLTARQLERAKKLWDRIGRFIETERKSSQWVDRFCYDHHPDIELDGWELMADVFERVCADGVSRGYALKDIASAVSETFEDESYSDRLSDEFIATIRETAATLCRRVSAKSGERNLLACYIRDFYYGTLKE